MSLKNIVASFGAGIVSCALISTHLSNEQQREYAKGLSEIDARFISYTSSVEKAFSNNALTKYLVKEEMYDITKEMIKCKKKINEEKIKYIEFD